MSAKPILYLGDTSLATAAGYLAGLLTHADLPFDYVPSDVPLAKGLIAGRKLFIVSDYPASNMEEKRQREIVRAVEEGAGLLMIGGWESFQGQAGRWAGTPLAAALPVHILRQDDRFNCDQPALARAVGTHPITAGLPFDSRPPTIGGFNRISPKDDAIVVLEIERFLAYAMNGRTAFDSIDVQPLLVVGKHGKGRTAALATDLAPHWVGGLVDWGEGERVTAQAAGAWPIEVGNLYARFVRQLITWTGKFESALIPPQTAAAR